MRCSESVQSVVTTMIQAWESIRPFIMVLRVIRSQPHRTYLTMVHQKSIAETINIPTICGSMCTAVLATNAVLLAVLHSFCNGQLNALVIQSINKFLHDPNRYVDDGRRIRDALILLAPIFFQKKYAVEISEKR